MKIKNDAVIMDRVDVDKVETFDDFDSACGLVFDEEENLETFIIQMRVICEVDVSDLDISGLLGESMELETIESKRSAFGKWLCKFIGINPYLTDLQIFSHRLSKVLDGNTAYGRKMLRGFDDGSGNHLRFNVDEMEKV